MISGQHRHRPFRKRSSKFRLRISVDSWPPVCRYQCHTYSDSSQRLRTNFGLELIPPLTKPIFPQELVDNIVQEVGSIKDPRDRQSALRACALTSWSFLTPSRRILFAEISLQEDSGNDSSHQNNIRSKLERFWAILQHHPHLELNVRTLTVQLSSFRTYRNHEDDLRTQNAQKAILPSILSSLSNVRCFSLAFDVIWDDYNCWEYMDAPLQEGLFRFCSSRSITQLSLSIFWDLPITLIIKCPQLTSLSLYRVFLTQNDPASQPSSVTNLKHLSVGGGRVTSPWISSHLNTRSCYLDLALSSLETLQHRVANLPDFNFDVPSVTSLSVKGTCKQSYFHGNVFLLDMCYQTGIVLSFNTITMQI